MDANSKLSWRRTNAMFILALAACLPGGHADAQQDKGSVILYDKDSQYYRIRVVDEAGGKRRSLYFSRYRGVQSRMLRANPDALDFEYARSMIAAFALHGKPKNVLLVGLGGASLPKFIQKHFHGTRLDIVEIDPDVVRVAQKYFFFKPAPETRIYVMDGRMFLKWVVGKYDVILLDAFAGDRIPFHLTTKEFLQLVREHLVPNGVVAGNLWNPHDTRFRAAETATYLQVFPQTYLFKCGNSSNVVVFGAMSRTKVECSDWVGRATAVARGRALGFGLPKLIRNEYSCQTGVRVRESALTDEMAPVDTLLREHPRHFEEAQPAR